MATLGDVIADVRALLGDTYGEWVSRDYILPFINSTYRLMYLQMKNATGRNLEGYAEILNVPVGTSQLATAPGGTQALAGLYDPIHVWWKLAGQPPFEYVPANRRMNLAMLTGPQVFNAWGSYGMYWTWMGNKLLTTPMSVPVDVLVDGRFNPPDLVLDTDALVISPDARTPLALGAAALAGVERTNPAILAGYGQAATAAVDNIVASLIRQKQEFPQRFARQAPRFHWGWF